MPKKPELSEADEDLRMDFGQRLRVFRESRNMRPEEVAAVGGISMAHQYRIEAGERTADVLYLQRLIERYGGEVATLLLGGVAQKTEKKATIKQSSKGDGAIQVAKSKGNIKITRREK